MVDSARLPELAGKGIACGAMALGVECIARLSLPQCYEAAMRWALRYPIGAAPAVRYMRLVMLVR